MKPIILKGHTRPLSQVKFNKDGDLLFSASVDQTTCIWRKVYTKKGDKPGAPTVVIDPGQVKDSKDLKNLTANFERLGVLKEEKREPKPGDGPDFDIGGGAANWSVDVDPTSTIAATGDADGKLKLWEVRTGKLLHKWSAPSAIKRVEFNEDGTKILAVTARRGASTPSNIITWNVIIDVDAEQSNEPDLTIVFPGSKNATVAGWSYLSKYIIVGFEDGSVSQYSAEHGKVDEDEDDGEGYDSAGLEMITENYHNSAITDLQWSPDRSYFLTASKDKTANLIDARDLTLLSTYKADAPLNTGAIAPNKEYVLLGGGQDAAAVTTTSSREGRFEARLHHKIFLDDLGRIPGHFGPLNTIAYEPNGLGYASGGEDGYIHVRFWDKAVFDFEYEVEREYRREQQANGAGKAITVS